MDKYPALICFEIVSMVTVIGRGIHLKLSASHPFSLYLSLLVLLRKLLHCYWFCW